MILAGFEPGPPGQVLYLNREAAMHEGVVIRNKF